MANKHISFRDSDALSSGISNNFLTGVSAPVAYNGETLEGILDDERIPNCLVPLTYLSFAKTPKSGTDDYRRSQPVKEWFDGWLERVTASEPLELDFALMRLIYRLHQPPRRDFARRGKLPRHVARDRRDPIALIVTAVQLLHDALPNRRIGRSALDIDRFVYVQDRLREAELVQVARRDIRFDALKALSAFVAAVITKHDPKCWACVETL